MHRDMDLCRKILVEVEKIPTTRLLMEIKLEGYTDDEIGYNAWLLADEGLIEGQDISAHGHKVHRYAPLCLTYKGHDFLEHARDDVRWKKAKDKITEISGAMTTQVILAVLKNLITKELGL